MAPATRGKWVVKAKEGAEPAQQPKANEAAKLLAEVKSWTDQASTTLPDLSQVCGFWRDNGKHGSSEYELKLNEDGMTLDVTTKRPTGRVVRTKSLIHAEQSKEGDYSGRLAWGHKSVYIATLCETSLLWERDGRPSFAWHRPYDLEEREWAECYEEERAGDEEWWEEDEEEWAEDARDEDRAEEAEAPEAQAEAIRMLLGLPQGASVGGAPAEGASQCGQVSMLPAAPPRSTVEDGRQAGRTLLEFVQSGRDAAASEKPDGARLDDAPATAAKADETAQASAAGSSSAAAASASSGAAGALAAALGVPDAAANRAARPAEDEESACSEVDAIGCFAVQAGGSVGSTQTGGSPGSTPKWPPPDPGQLEQELELPRPRPQSSDAVEEGTSSSSSAPGPGESIWRAAPEPLRWLPTLPMMVMWQPGSPTSQAALLQQLSLMLADYLLHAQLRKDSYVRSQMTVDGWVRIDEFITFGKMRTLGANLWALQQAAAGNPALELDDSGQLIRLRQEPLQTVESAEPAAPAEQAEAWQ